MKRFQTCPLSFEPDAVVFSEILRRGESPAQTPAGGDGGAAARSRPLPPRPLRPQRDRLMALLARLRRLPPLAPGDYVRSRVSGAWLSPLVADVLCYLSGMHPLVCGSSDQVERLDLVRELADCVLWHYRSLGLTDRHEVGQVLEIEIRVRQAFRR